MSRVLYIIDSLENGGAERQLALLLKHLPGEWQRRLWSLADGPFGDVIRAEGIRLDVRPRAGRLDVTPALGLWRLLLDWKPDVVHSWGWVASAMAGPLCRLTGIPLIEGSIRMGLFEPRRRGILKWNMLWAKRVITNSRAAVEAWGIDRGRASVVYNGFDPSRLELCDAKRDRAGASHDPFTVVMVGRMVMAKDFGTFIAAARELHGRRPGGWRFQAIGHGPNRAALQAEAQDLIDAGVMEFPEAGLEALHHVRRADAGVLISNAAVHAEGCSNVIMEYMACALPVICSEGGGNRELVVDGATGFVIPPADPGALADRLAWLNDHREEAVRLGAAGRERFDRMFPVETMVRETLAVYESLQRPVEAR